MANKINRLIARLHDLIVRATSRGDHPLPPHPDAGRRSPVIMVTAGSALLIIGILLFAGATLIAGRKSVITDNLKDLKRTSEILAENAQRLLFSADLQAASVEEQILNLGVKNPEDFRRMIRTESMHKELLSKLLALPDIDAMTIIDDKGDILASSRIWPPPKANVADRDYFQFLRDSPGGMVKIASVESNRVTGRGSILLVHRVTSPTDIFLGVVVATLAKNRFEKLFSTVLPSSRSAIAMYTLDGTRLVQESKFTGAAGSALDTNRHFEELLSQANYDQHRIPVTEPDESALLVSLHSVRGYPLVIEVANSEKKVLTEWSRIAWLTILFAGGAIILISVLSFALVRQWRMEGEIIQTKELQRLNNDLLRSERLLKAVFDVIPHYLFIRNTEGRMVMVNAAFAQFFGLHPEEIMGKPLSEITRNAEIINQWEEKDRLILQEGQIVRSPEFSVTRADGVNRWIHIIKLPLRGENDSIIGLVGLAEDTTERVQAEQRFRQSQKMEAVGQLAGGIAHDFNNMLQIIRGYADLVSQSMPPEFQYKKEIGHVIQAADNAAALTRQLLAFSRTQAAVLERLDLVDLLNEQSHMFSRLIGDHIEFSIHSQTDSVFVVADPLQLQQVLLNLCVNARDAMPKGGRLTIEIQTFHADGEFCTRNSWAKSGDYAVIVVSDTGKGMVKEVQDHIFEPFFTTKEVGQGTGLGLFTVYGIVRQHGGMVHCYSEPGLGTTFRIYLPLGSSTVTKSAPQVSKPVVRGGHETVLIAEDHDDVRAYLAQLLEQNGYQVLQARSGEEAITQFEAHQNTVSLILSDMVMPKLSGADLFRHVNKINPGLPMIILTGYAGNLSQTLPVNSGVLKIVQKPYGPDDLLKEIREALDTPA